MHNTNESNLKHVKLEIEIKTLNEEVFKIGLAVTGLSVKLDEVIKNISIESYFKCELSDYNTSSTTVLNSHLNRKHKQETLYLT